MVQEAERLQECIQHYLDIFYAQEVYLGSGDLQKSLRHTSKVEVESDGKLSIKVYFDEDQSWGESWMGDFGYDGALKPYLVAYGFKDMSQEHYTFQGYKGNDFIQKGIEKFESENPYGLKVILNLPEDTDSIWR